MVITNLLRVPQHKSKSKDESILVHVQQENSETFEIEIDATEGNYAYTRTLKKNSIKDTKARAFGGTTEELQACILWCLLRHDPPTKFREAALSTEALVEVEAGKHVNLIVRQRVENITPDVCMIRLQCTEKSIELFDWCGESAQRAIEAERNQRQLQSDVYAQAEELKSLRAQFNELVKAKEKHENEILEKFRQLLNSKKSKIRDQQRLLAGAKVSKSNGVSPTRHSAKRKAVQIKEEASSDSSEGFEAAAPGPNVDKASDVDEGGDQRGMTPQQSEREDTDENDSIGSTACAQVEQGIRRTSDSKSASPRHFNDPPQKEDKSTPTRDVTPEEEGEEETDDEL